MTRAAVRRGAGLLSLAAAVALTGACDANGKERAKPPSPRPPAAQNAVVTYGEPAKEILDQAFVGREALTGGYGRLEERFGSTAPAAPKNVRSVAFAFTCTGGGKVTLVLTRGLTHTVTCDKTIFQQSVQTPEPGVMGFEVAATDSKNGVFAYSYYVESKQLP